MKQNAPKKLFVFGGIGAAVLLLLIVLIVSFVFRKTTLVPEDYISYQITGLSTEGNVSLTFDCQKLISDIKEKKKLTAQHENSIY